MDTLKIVDVGFHGQIPGANYPIEHFEPMTWEFSYGQSYILSGSPISYEFDFGKSLKCRQKVQMGGWALSWIIAGQFEPHQGSIYRNGVLYPREQRKHDAWCVQWDEIKRYGLFRQSVRAQVRHGLKTTPNPYLKTETEIIERFFLTPERYGRLLRQQSGEAWRSSCAIGLAHGKRIFCFPEISRVVQEYTDLWLKEVVDLLTASGALVLIPARATETAKRLCNSIVNLYN